MDWPDFNILTNPDLDVSGIPFLASAQVEKLEDRKHYLTLSTGGSAYFLTENAYSDSLHIPIYMLPLKVTVTVETRWYGTDDQDTYELTLSQDFKLTYEQVRPTDTTVPGEA